jgi:hypothetical protein
MLIAVGQQRNAVAQKRNAVAKDVVAQERSLLFSTYL